MEDLDSLLADLNDNTTNTKQTSGTQSSRIDLDELDDLMNDLNENDNQQQPNYQQDDFGVDDLGIQEDTAPPQQGGADELDDLLEGLSSVSSNPPPQQKPAPVQQNRPSMQQQTRPSAKTPAKTVASKPVQQQTQIDTTLDDLDALVDDLGSNTRASQQPPPSNNKSKNTSISSDDTLDELDMLMNDLDTPPPKTTPVKASPPVQNRPSQVSPQVQNKPMNTQQNRPSQAPQQNRPSQVSPQVQARGSTGAFPQNPRNTQQPNPQVQPRNTVATFGNNAPSPQNNRPSQQFQDRSTVSTFGNNNRPSQQFNSPQQNRPSQQFNNPQQNRPSQQYGGGGGGDDLDDLLAGMDDMNVGGNNNPPPRTSNNTGFQNNTRTSNFGNTNNTRTSNFGGNNQGMGGMGGMGGMRPQPQPINFTPVPVQSGPSRGICGGCNQPIHGQILQALGKMWHPEHFVCGNCRSELGTANFYEQEGKPHCENCYQQLFCPRCAACDQPIMSRVITALGKKWHPEHFVCTTCQAPFPGGTFYEREGYPYCQEHYYNSSFAVKCASCGEGIVGDCINALNQQWHTNCFVCQYCHKAFTTGQFYEMNGMPYCEMHYYSASGAMCAACNKSITGKSVSALGKNWHPEHFVCGFCYQPIPGGNYTERDGKAYCNECHGKLYS